MSGMVGWLNNRFMGAALSSVVIRLDRMNRMSGMLRARMSVIHGCSWMNRRFNWILNRGFDRVLNGWLNWIVNGRFHRVLNGRFHRRSNGNLDRGFDRRSNWRSNWRSNRTLNRPGLGSGSRGRMVDLRSRSKAGSGLLEGTA